MKVLFAHDHIFYKYMDKYYSTGGLSKKVLDRYTNIYENVTVISRQKEIHDLSGKLTLATTENVNFVNVPNFNSIKSLKNYKKAKRIIEEEIEACDVLIARMPSSIASIAINIAKKKEKPVLVEVVACAWDALWNHSIIGKLIAPISYTITKNRVKSAPYAIYVTNKFLQERYPNNGKGIACSDVELKPLEESILESRLDRIKNIKDTEPIVLGTIGAIDIRYKGQENVIKTLKILKESGNNNFVYHLVGGGNTSYLRHIARENGVLENVEFIGTVGHDQVLDWLDNIDVYIQPSLTEGMPRALIEAMSRGLPCIGTRVGGIPELLNDSYLVHKKKNINEIFALLKNLTLEEMREQAIRNFKETQNYNKDILRSKRDNFYMEFKENAQLLIK